MENREIEQKIVFCSVCNNLTDVNPCMFCTSAGRDRSVICVVEEPHNLEAIEEALSFKGLYHVLHGSLSPTRGISPNELMLDNLLPRLMPNNDEGVEVKEVIVATDPTIDGEATANYIARLLKPLGVKVTRISIETPVDSDFEFVN